MNFLLADFSQWILPGVLLLMVIGLFVMSFVRNKRYQETTKNLINNLKKGDKVKTYSGLYGKIIEIKETNTGKVVTLETGSGKKIGYLTIDINAIYGIADETPVAYDKDGNIITPEINKPETVVSEPKAEVVPEDKVEQSPKTLEPKASTPKTSKPKTSKSKVSTPKTSKTKTSK